MELFVSPVDYKLRIINVVGARPNFMKIAPLMAEYKLYSQIEPLLVHTGQHYDSKMSQLFFDELEIPKPDVYLEVGSASHAVQTAEIMKRFEPMVINFKPDVVLVVGDVNSTIACALVAAKLGIKVAHVEAGLRSFDRQMPEEINRILTDAISDFLFITEPSAFENLKKEGISKEKIFFVGNVMIDTLLRNQKKAAPSKILDQLNLPTKSFAVITLHRPSNVDNPERLRKLVDVLQIIGKKLPIIFPVHPRTKKNLQNYIQDSAQPLYSNDRGLRLIEPLGYLDFLKLMTAARFVLTDSGGIQEETTILGIPCLTLRENTERPITVKIGTNMVVGTDPKRILSGFEQVMNSSKIQYRKPKFWDGKAASRIIKILLKSFIG